MVVMILILGVTGVLLATTVKYIGPQLNIIIPIAATGLFALVIKAVIQHKKSTHHDLSEIRKILLEEISNVNNQLSINRLNQIADQRNIKPEKIFADLSKGPLMDQGMKALMEQDYKTAVKLFEENAKAKIKEAALSWFFEGNAFYFLREYHEAIAAYRKSTNFNPKLAKAWNNWSETLKTLDRHEEAIEKFNKAIEHDPSIANVESTLSQDLKSIDPNEEKVEKCIQAMELQTADLVKN